MKSDLLSYSLTKADRLLRSGKTGQAVEIYQSVLQKLPKNERALGKLGFVYASQSNWVNVVEVYRTLCAVRPNAIFYKIRLIAALGKNGNHDEARNILNASNDHGVPLKCLEEMALVAYLPTNERQSALIALLNNGDHSSTEIAARFFIDDYENHPLGYQVLSATLIEKNNYLEALKVAEGASEIFSKDANCFYMQAIVQEKLGRFECALKSLRIAKTLDPLHKNAAMLEQKLLTFMTK